MAWVKVAGMSGAAAVGLGAYGAHGMKGVPSNFSDVYKTAGLYHLVHSAALLTCAYNLHGRKRNIVCGLITSGIILFSGGVTLTVNVLAPIVPNVVLP